MYRCNHNVDCCQWNQGSFGCPKSIQFGYSILQSTYLKLTLQCGCFSCRIWQCIKIKSINERHLQLVSEYVQNYDYLINLLFIFPLQTLTCTCIKTFSWNCKWVEILLVLKLQSRFINAYSIWTLPNERWARGRYQHVGSNMYQIGKM